MLENIVGRVTVVVVVVIETLLAVVPVCTDRKFTWQPKPQKLSCKMFQQELSRILLELKPKNILAELLDKKIFTSNFLVVPDFCETFGAQSTCCHSALLTTPDDF